MAERDSQGDGDGGSARMVASRWDYAKEPLRRELSKYVHEAGEQVASSWRTLLLRPRLVYACDLVRCPATSGVLVFFASIIS